MPRIRTVKPEFWTSDSIGALTREARLLLLACLNLADDEGLLRWNPAYLMANAFMYDDDINVKQVSEWMDELVTEQFIFKYVAGRSNANFAFIIKFRNHQVINRPQKPKCDHPSIQNNNYKSAIYMRDNYICHLCGDECDPLSPINICNSKAPSIDHVHPVSKGGSHYPSNLKTACLSCNKRRGNRVIDSDDVNDSVSDSLTEREREREEDLYSCDRDESQSPDSCPYQKIVNLYHQALPELPCVVKLTDKRKSWLKARWRESIEHQDLEFWKKYFSYVRESDFLLGRPENGTTKRAWQADFEWLINSSNFVKVLEGKYHA